MPVEAWKPRPRQAAALLSSPLLRWGHDRDLLGGLGLVGRLGVGIDGGEDDLGGGGVMVGSHGDLGLGVMAALDHGEQGECALSAACAICFGPEFALITRRFPEFLPKKMTGPKQ